MRTSESRRLAVAEVVAPVDRDVQRRTDEQQAVRITKAVGDDSKVGAVGAERQDRRASRVALLARVARRARAEVEPSVGPRDDRILLVLLVGQARDDDAATAALREGLRPCRSRRRTACGRARAAPGGRRACARTGAAVSCRERPRRSSRCPRRRRGGRSGRMTSPWDGRARTRRRSRGSRPEDEVPLRARRRRAFSSAGEPQDHTGRSERRRDTEGDDQEAGRPGHRCSGNEQETDEA